MKEKLRRLLGRGRQSNASGTESKKKRKNTLHSLLSQHPTANQNYYFKNGIDQDEKNDGLKNVDFKKSEEISLESENSVSENSRRVIEVTLERIRDENINVQSSEALAAALTLTVTNRNHKQDLTQIKNKEKCQSLKCTINAIKGMPPQSIKQPFKLRPQGDSEESTIFSDFSLHNQTPQAKCHHTNEKISKKASLSHSMHKSTPNTAALEFERAAHYTNVSSPQPQQCRENFSRHTPMVQSEQRHLALDGSFHCEFLQQLPHSSQENIQSFSCPNRHLQASKDSDKSPSANHFMNLKNDRSCRSEHRADRDVDWGWVSVNPEANSLGTTLDKCNETSVNCPVSMHQTSHSHPCTRQHPLHLQHPTSCSQQCASRFVTSSNRSSVSNCIHRKTELLHCRETSTRPMCTPSECRIARKRPSPTPACRRTLTDNHVDVCSHNTSRFISIKIRGQENSPTRIFEVQSETEQKCNDHHMRLCHCCDNAVSSALMEWEPLLSTTCKFHCAEKECGTSFRDSTECCHHSFRNFEANSHFGKEETTMAPSVVLFTDEPNLNTCSSNACQSLCCQQDFVQRNCFHMYSNCNAIDNQPPTNGDRTFNMLNSIGQFQLSPKSYSKLITYCHSKKMLTGLPHVNDNLHNRQTQNAFHVRNPLERKPTRAYNLYAEPGQETRSRLLYGNQAAIDMCRLAQVFETVEECPWYWGELSGEAANKILAGTPIGTFLLRNSSERRYLFSLSLVTRRGPTSIRIVYTNGGFRFDADGEENKGDLRRRLSEPTTRQITKYRQCVIHLILQYTKYLSKSNQKETRKISNSFSTPDSSTKQNIRQTNRSTPIQPDTKIINQSHMNDIEQHNDASEDSGQFLCSWVGHGQRREIEVSIYNPHKHRNATLQELCRKSISKNVTLWKNPEKVEQLPLPVSLKEYVKKYPYPI